MVTNVHFLEGDISRRSGSGVQAGSLAVSELCSDTVPAHYVLLHPLCLPLVCFLMFSKLDSHLDLERLCSPHHVTYP